MDISTANLKIIDNQFIVKKRLGKGYTAKVMLGEHTTTKTPVALKIYVPKNGQTLSMKEFKTEMESMQKIKSSNVISILAANNKGVYERPGKKSKQIVYIGMEVAENAELFDFIAEPGLGFSEKIARFYFIQLISGLKSIHDEKFAHRDLKTENIFLDKNFNLKIGDFGFAKYIENGKSDKLKTILGTVGYQCPELLENKGYNGSANDIFACGVILFIIANAFPPFKEAKLKDPWYKNIYNGEHKKFWEIHHKRLSVKTESLKTLLSGMLAKNSRFSLDDVIKSDWFNGELPSKEELLNDLGSRKKIVDAKRKKQCEEKLKIKSKGTDNKVYRGEGDVADIEKITELFNNIDFTNNKIKNFDDFDLGGNFSVLNFIGDCDNNMSLGKFLNRFLLI